ncbi:Deoxyribose-phosphate aldolase [uncultured Paludibacter sp.]|uniref:Deoxyribose-phosphate aldolase n=1 Tax=uncultured Paludibacter sp. TaxID=497635 RepID=A0A653AJJ3_9BACT|nr:Deoxyribose-phosphate aldolase [uncultured Paludibacter sp.]
MKDFKALFNEYQCDSLTDEVVKKNVEDILSKYFDENNTKEVYKKCLNLIDLTSLNGTDTEGEITSMMKKVNEFEVNFPDLQNVAAVCVYPAMVPVVKANLTEPIGIASVAAGFPASQTFIEVKVAETAMAVMEGATEIDVVISLGKFLEGKYDEVFEELEEIKTSCREAHLKVILETGALTNAADIKKASVLSMAANADFIKTSTGKIPVAATTEATYVMCTAIKEWYEKTGIKVGYKPAGGIVTTEDAVKHYTLVKEILGEEWLNNEMFRFGASRLANNLLTSIEGRNIKYF